MPLGRVIPARTLVFTTGSPVDFNGDGILGAADIDLLCAQIQQDERDPKFDINQDGVVDKLDHDAMIFDHLGSTFGDANLDGVFNSADFVLVFQGGTYEDGVLQNSGWAEGDWNCDGDAQASYA